MTVGLLALTTALGSTGAFIETDPTIMRYYSHCGRSDVRPLSALEVGTPEFERAATRWSQDAAVLERLLVARNAITDITLAVDALVQDRTCERLDFSVAVPPAVAARRRPTLPVDVAPTPIIVPYLAPPTPAVTRNPPSTTTWVATGLGAALSITGGALAWEGRAEARAGGSALAAARRAEDSAARSEALARVDAGHGLLIGGAAGLGVGLGLVTAAWSVRW